MNSRGIPIAAIPMAVWEQAENRLRHYFVPILAVWKHERVSDPKVIGSGTLLNMNGKGYILTAAHVWDAAAGADQVHLLLIM